MDILRNGLSREEGWDAFCRNFEGCAEYFFPTPMPKPPGGPQTPTHPPPSALNCLLWSVVSAELIHTFGVLQSLNYVLPPLESNCLWEYGLSRNSLQKRPTVSLRNSLKVLFPGSRTRGGVILSARVLRVCVSACVFACAGR